jgi:hypothetical protein
MTQYTVRRSAIALAAVAAIGTSAPVAAASGGGSTGLGSGFSARSSSPTSTPCFQGTSTSCTSTDPDVTLSLVSRGSTAGCTFKGSFAWGDGDKVDFAFNGGANGAILVTEKHHYKAKGIYNGTWSSTVTGGLSCYSNSGTFQFTLAGCTKAQLSGPAWAHVFEDSKSLSTLSGPFKTRVTRFLAAAHKAGIHVSIKATRRPRELAYLYHWSWLIAKGRANPADVPAFVPATGEKPVDICWTHTNADGTVDKATSVTAAKQMVKALGIDPTLTTAPSDKSLHVQGNAIDMTLTWTKHTITIRNASGHEVKIDTTPRSGLNRRLIKVGATYGVIHLKAAKGDRNHWSTTGA